MNCRGFLDEIETNYLNVFNSKISRSIYKPLFQKISLCEIYKSLFQTISLCDDVTKGATFVMTSLKAQRL